MGQIVYMHSYLYESSLLYEIIFTLLYENEIHVGPVRPMDARDYLVSLHHRKEKATLHIGIYMRLVILQVTVYISLNHNHS